MRTKSPMKSVPEALTPVRLAVSRPRSIYDPDVICPSIEQMASEGQSFVEIAVNLNVSPKTLQFWASTYPEFRECVERSRLLMQAYWERIGRMNVENPRFNTTLWMHHMSNRFGWSKTDGNVENTLPVPKEEPKQIESPSIESRVKVLRILRDAGVLPGPSQQVTVDVQAIGEN